MSNCNDCSGCICDSSAIEVISGNTLEKVWTFQHKDPDPLNIGEFIYTPYDLSIFTSVTMVIRKSPEEEPIATASIDLGNFIISGADNNVLELSKLYIPSVVGVYRYYIDFSGTDIIKTLLQGSFYILPK